MADRLFDRGLYKEAKTEYAALKNSEGIAGDDILYRLAECESALGEKAAARKSYSELVEKFPLSRHAPRSRLMKALAGSELEKIRELRALDADGVPNDTRAAALYHLGAAENNVEALSRSLSLDPKGRYSAYAKYRRAILNSSSSDPARLRSAVADFLEIHHSGTKDLADESLFLAAETSYSGKKYGEASSLFRRYMKLYPESENAAKARAMAAWSDYASGKYADAAVMCGDGSTDDASYILASCAYATGEYEKARELLAAYLEKFPEGKYRKAVELPLARLDYDAAEKAGDSAKAVEAAKRSVSLSGSAADMMRLAWAYEKGGNAADAEAEYEKISLSFPKTAEAADALYRRAMTAVRERKWSRADLLLAEAAATGKNGKRKAETAYWRGVSAVMLSHEAEGKKLLKEALSAGLPVDLSREARIMVADCDFSAGRRKEAKAAYASLVNDGAIDRMSASKLRTVGRLLLEGGGDGKTLAEAKKCGEALAGGSDPGWRQAGFALKGAAEEALGEFTAAMESYRSALAEKVRVEDAAEASLALGILESKAGNHIEADKVLKECVTLNASDSSRRAQAYMWLSKNCEAMTDYRGACAYATVILSLFDDDELSSEAKKILDRHAEAAK